MKEPLSDWGGLRRQLLVIAKGPPNERPETVEGIKAVFSAVHHCMSARLEGKMRRLRRECGAELLLSTLCQVACFFSAEPLRRLSQISWLQGPPLQRLAEGALNFSFFSGVKPPKAAVSRRRLIRVAAWIAIPTPMAA